MSKRANKEEEYGSGGGGRGKKNKKGPRMAKAESEEEEDEEEVEDRKMTPSEHEMMDLNKEIKALKADVERYEAKIEEYEKERNQCAEERKDELLRTITATHNNITAARNNITELLRQQTAREEGVDKRLVFRPGPDDFLFSISHLYCESSFRAQCCLDTGSEFELILPRRKIGQLGLRCIGQSSVTARCGGGSVLLYEYEPVRVEFIPLEKSANLMVYGVHPRQVAEAWPDYKPGKPTLLSPKKKLHLSPGTSKAPSSSLSSSPAAAASEPPTRKSPRKSYPVSPCFLSSADIIDAEILIGDPGQEKLEVIIDQKRKRVRAVKRIRVAKRGGKWRV